MAKLKQIQDVLGKNVRRLRREYAPEGFRGINKFAKLCGIGNNALQAIESGRGNPELETLMTIASKLRVEVWHLFIPGATPDNAPKVVTPAEIALYLKFEKLVEERGAETGKFASLK